MKITIAESGILYCNPLPQLRPIHAIHPVTQQLSEKEILCVYRRGTALESADGRIGKLRSTDGGKTWTKPQSTGMEGQISGPADLGEGRLLLVYNRRSAERPGIVAIASEDGGETWDTEEQVMVWDARGQAIVGTRSKESAFADMATFGFGKPTRKDSLMAMSW